MTEFIYSYGYMFPLLGLGIPVITLMLTFAYIGWANVVKEYRNEHND